MRSMLAPLLAVAWALGCSSAPAPEPVTLPPAEPAPRPITIADAPPPKLAEPPPEVAPPPNPLLERLTADSETLREDGREIAKRQPLPVRIEAVDRLLAVGNEIKKRAWADPALGDRRAEEAYDAMAEVGGERLADFLLGEAETDALPLPRRRAAFVAAESALPGDVSRATRRAALSSKLVKLGAKEPKVEASVHEARAVTTRLSPGFRRCYLRALEMDPALEVTFRVSLAVDSRGVVTQAKADPTPARDLARCVEAIGRAALFSPLTSGTTIVVPIAFTPNRVRTL